MILHKTFIAELAGCMKAGIDINSNDVHISYLPLAHIYEKMLVELLMANGASIGFYSGVCSQHKLISQYHSHSHFSFSNTQHTTHNTQQTHKDSYECCVE
jgi:long-subunit acyl-CoA synthetase (AMP-forming)